MKNYTWIYLVLLLMVAGLGCTDKYTPPVLTRPYGDTPAAPDYANENNWAALPEKSDNADRFPSWQGLCNLQEVSRADVSHRRQP